MIETKVLEVRDSGTRIDVLAIKMRSHDWLQQYYFRANGYNRDECNIAMLRLNDGQGRNDPFDWPPSARTMQIAHQYIQDGFDGLKDGDVVDVQHIVGETPEPKIAERLKDPFQ